MSVYPYDHVDHRVRSLSRVRAFYDELMPALGYADIQVGRTYCAAHDAWPGPDAITVASELGIVCLSKP